MTLMNPAIWIALASTGSALAAVGSFLVATQTWRNEEIRQSRAELYAAIGPTGGVMKHALYLWNDGPGSALNVRITVYFVGPDLSGNPPVDMELGEDAAELGSGSCVEGRMAFAEATAHELRVDIHWDEHRPRSWPVRLSRRLRSKRHDDRYSRRRIQMLGAKSI